MKKNSFRIITTFTICLLFAVNISDIANSVFNYSLASSYFEITMIIMGISIIRSNLKEFFNKFEIETYLIVFKIFIVILLILHILMINFSYKLLLEFLTIFILYELIIATYDSFFEKNISKLKLSNNINLFINTVIFIEIIFSSIIMVANKIAFIKIEFLFICLLIVGIIFKIISLKLELNEKEKFDFEKELELLNKKNVDQEKKNLIDFFYKPFSIFLTSTFVFMGIVHILSIKTSLLVKTSQSELVITFFGIFIIFLCSVINFDKKLIVKRNMKLITNKLILISKLFILIILSLLLYHSLFELIFNQGTYFYLMLFLEMIIILFVMLSFVKFNYSSKFSSNIYIGITFILYVLNNMISLGSVHTNSIYMNLIFFILIGVLVISFWLRKINVLSVNEIINRKETPIYLFALMLVLVILLNFVTMDISDEILSVVNEMLGLDYTHAQISISTDVFFAGLIVSCALLTTDISNKKIKSFLIVIKSIAVIIILHNISSFGDYLVTKDETLLPSILTLLSSLSIAGGISTKGLKFFGVIIMVLMYIIIVEFVFYITGVFKIEMSGLTLNTYRLLFGLIILLLLFAYIYLRNISLERSNKIFPRYRFLNAFLIVIILFFGTVTSGVTKLSSDFSKEAIVDAILNSPIIDMLDPAFIQEILDEVGMDDLPDFSPDNIDKLPTYMEVKKDTDYPLFLRESTGMEFDVSTGWNYGYGDLITSTNDFSKIRNDELLNYQNFFNNTGIFDWYLNESINIQYPSERLIEDNQLSFNTIFDNLSVENKNYLSSYTDGRIVADNYNVGEINFESYNVDLSNPLVVAAIVQDLENNSYNYNDYLNIDSTLYGDIISIRNTIKTINNITSATNDALILGYISDYISSFKTIVINEIWENNEDIISCIDENLCNIGESATLFTLIARSFDIPVRTTKGYFAFDKSTEVKYLAKSASFEFEIPSLGWVDGSFYMANIFDNTLPGEAEEENVTIPEDYLFKYSSDNKSGTTFIRDSIYSSYNDNSKEFYNYVCDTNTISHIDDISYLQNNNIDLIDNLLSINNANDSNKSIYSPLYVDSIDYGGQVNPCMTGDSGIFSKSDDDLFRNYLVNSKTINWDINNTYIEINDIFENNSSSADYTEFVVDNNISNILLSNNPLDVTIINTLSNDYLKFMYISSVVDKTYQVIEVDNSLSDTIKNREGSIENIIAIKASLASIYNVSTRLVSGFNIDLSEEDFVTRNDITLGIELFMPTENGGQWITLPDHITMVAESSMLFSDYYETFANQNRQGFNITETIDLCNDIMSIYDPIIGVIPITENEITIKGQFTQSGCNIELIQQGKIEVEYEVYSYLNGKYYDDKIIININESSPIVNEISGNIDNIIETEIRDLCTELVEFTEPITGSLINISHSNIKLINQPAGSQSLTDCFYNFNYVGDYEFQYNVTSNDTGVSLTYNININVSEAELIIIVNQNYDHATNLTSEINGVLNVLRTKDVDLCSYLMVLDPIELIRINNGFMPSDTSLLTYYNEANINEITLNSCTTSFNSLGNSTIGYDFKTEIIPGSGLTRNKYYDLDINVLSEDLIIPNGSNFEIFETESKNLIEHMGDFVYETGHKLDRSDISLYIDSIFFNGDDYKFIEDPGNNSSINVDIKYELLDFTGIKEHLITARVFSAEPINLVYNGEATYSIINGQIPNNSSFYNLFSAHSQLGETLKIVFTITAKSGNQISYNLDIDDDIKNFFNNGGIIDYENLSISIDVIEEKDGINRVSSYSNVLIKVYSEELNIAISNIDSFYDSAYENVDLTKYITITDKLGNSNYINNSFSCIINGVNINDCTNFNSGDYDTISSGTNSINYTFYDIKGKEYNRSTNFEILSSEPMIDASKLFNIEFYKNYTYNLCSLVEVLDYNGNIIENNDLAFSIDGSTYIDCSTQNDYKFNQNKIYKLKFNVNDRGYNYETPIIDIDVNNQDAPPIIVVPRSLSHMTLSNTITTLSNDSDFVFQESEPQDYCTLVEAIDPGNQSPLSPVSINILNKDDNTIIESFYDCSITEWNYNDPGEYIFEFTFTTIGGVTDTLGINITILPEVISYNLLADMQKSKYGHLVLVFIGYDNSDNPIFADNNGVISLGKIFTNNQDLVLGQIFESLYIYEDNKIVLVDAFEFWNKKYIIEPTNISNIDTSSTSTCLIDTVEKYHFKDYEFAYYEVDGDLMVVDSCNTYTLEEINSLIDSDILSLIGEFTENNVYSYRVFFGYNGIELTENILIESVFDIRVIINNIIIVLAIIAILFTIYITTIGKKIKVKFLIQKIDDEIPFNDDEFNSKLESVKVNNKGFEYLRIYYSKLIEKRYLNIVKTYKKVYKRKNIMKTQTHHEYMEYLLRKEKNFNKDELMNITDIYTRCKYYELTVLRNHYLYINNYYHNFFDDLESVIVSSGLKVKIKKMKKF